ncbi:hypothetical protein [Nocardia coffeae]|nr:hypothetical protein [Nocardia coffeae]
MPRDRGFAGFLTSPLTSVHPDLRRCVECLLMASRSDTAVRDD